MSKVRVGGTETMGELEETLARAEVESLRNALRETHEKLEAQRERTEEAEHTASVARDRAETAFALEKQVVGLEQELAVQVRLRQEAQDLYIAENRALKKAHAELAADCYGCGNTSVFSAKLQSLRAQLAEAQKIAERDRLARDGAEKALDTARERCYQLESQLAEAPARGLQRKVESQRVALAGLEERNAILTEKVASEWARAERLGYERSQFLNEIQRFTPKIAAHEDQVETIRTVVRHLYQFLNQSDVRAAVNKAWGDVADDMALARDVAEGKI